MTSPSPTPTGKAATMSAETYESAPKPGEPQCEADGVRNGPDGPGGTEHYWSCTAPGTVDVHGALLCEDHAGELGHGPKQEEYGFDPAGGLKTAPGHPSACSCGACIVLRQHNPADPRHQMCEVHHLCLACYGCETCEDPCAAED